ncbi:skin secretory protein xP2 isoform X2 [Morone saxatilis]|uniref:skin secretory protein xP2 isoform X2 n=1 Tax=Morone saxatilis TaxID=34816 RepID=UPI0015E21DA5|nr:skin secretory protein xP2 isoform X2 [Morone saxatilis]
MEETLQQEKQESEYKNPNEDQGGIRRRLRDRDLLRKRKAEAEEKETNQVESQRKRPRAEDRSGAKKKGRPRKTEPKPEVSAIQQEAAPPQEGPAVVVVPEPTEVILDQTASSLSPLLAVESKPASVLAAPSPLPLFGSIRSPVFAPTLTPPAPALFSPSVPAQAPAKDLDTAPVPVQDLAPAPDAAPVTTSDPAAAPSAAPPQVDPFYIGSQGSKALDQVLIEDLGPDEEQDTPVPQDKRADEDLSGTPLINVPEQNKMFSVPTFPQPPPPQEYFPGNSF